MKNTIKLIGIIAIAAVIGFGMAACNNGTTSGAGNKGITITDIPAEYIGQYAGFSIEGGGAFILGGDRVEIEGQNITLHFTKVTGSTVTIPLWTFPDPDSFVVAGYSGNDSYTRGPNSIAALIINKAQHTTDGKPIPYIKAWTFESVTFSQGSAELSVNDAGE